MLREVPSGWQLGKLGSFVEEFKVLDSAGDLPPLSVTKSNGIVLQSEKFNKRIANTSSSKYKVVSSGEYAYDPMSLYYGAIGRLNVCDAGIVSPAYITFRLKGAIESGFFDLYVKTSDFLVEVNKVTTGGNQDGKRKKTDWNSFCSLPISLPPLHEQRRIAEILSSVDEAIAATRAVIEQTRKVKQGVLERLLTKGIGHTRFKQTEIGEIPEGWDVAPIEAYLARLIDYRGVPPPKSDSGVPLITAKNVRFGYLNPEPREYIREDDFDGWMRRGLPEVDDVLFTTEAPLGNVAQVPDYKIALGQRTITLCPDRARLTPTFLKWLLLSPGSQARIAEKATGSTALGIKQSTFRKLKFPFPPLDEQETIAEHIEGIAAAEAVETTKLINLNLLKAALMSDLLTGRKRVTDAQPLAAE